MMKLLASLALAGILVVACAYTEDQKRALAEYAAQKVETKQWTPEQAEGFLSGRAIDWEAIGLLFGGILTSVGAAYGLVQLRRGPAKPIPKDAVPAFQEANRPSSTA